MHDMSNQHVTACMGGSYVTGSMIKNPHHAPQNPLSCANDSIIWKSDEEIENFLCGDDKYCVPMIFDDELNKVRQICKTLQVAPGLFESFDKVKLDMFGANNKPLCCVPMLTNLSATKKT